MRNRAQSRRTRGGCPCSVALFTRTRRTSRTGTKPPRVGYGYLRAAFLTSPKELEKAQRRLKRLKIPFGGPVDHDLTWSIYFQDLNGLPLEITHDKR